jgi:hypothetical protein
VTIQKFRILFHVQRLDVRSDAGFYGYTRHHGRMGPHRMRISRALASTLGAFEPLIALYLAPLWNVFGRPVPVLPEVVMQCQDHTKLIATIIGRGNSGFASH